MVNQHELSQSVPQQHIPTPKTTTTGPVDSIFIIKSLLSAIIKDYLSESNKNTLPISKLKQEITLLLEENKVSYSYFSYIDTQFYLMLAMLKGYHRLTILILNEKRHIDTAIGDTIKNHNSYNIVFRTYLNILNGIESNNFTEASNAIDELSKLLAVLSLKA